ncbi:M18 family aminopeptidase [Myxococcota bacterium]|nr:M18 family aminopeptidase [Myxococcota bacterium]
MPAPKQLERTKALLSRARERALDLVAYVDASPTPYHAVAESVRRLEAAGFSRLDEGDEWKLRAGDRRYVTRGGSSIIAFHVGTASPAKGGFKMIGAHTDSPNLKLKPRASYTKNGYRQLGVEVYGGVLLHTWLDRDLGVAGRVAVRGPKGGVELKMLDLGRPILRIPNLAIHLNRDVNTNGLKINQQTNLPPILALVDDSAGKKDDQDFLKKLLSETLQVPEDHILDHDLSLYDVQKGTLGGLDDELIFTARLDNLASCHAALDALIATVDHVGEATKLVALHDHEEVGSRSAQGAAGPFLENVTERVTIAHEKAEPQGFARAMARSFHVSADMAHAVHPNYSDRHEPQHMPMIGQGPVIKMNASQSYASDGESAARFAALCHEAGFEPQSFVTRTDLGCGSTIGPITAGRLGVKTVDIGGPMMSMHSIREMAGVLDVELMHRPLALFFRG